MILIELFLYETFGVSFNGIYCIICEETEFEVMYKKFLIVEQMLKQKTEPQNPTHVSFMFHIIIVI